jgi:MYXO-CTERM domain-containing protein
MLIGLGTANAESWQAEDADIHFEGTQQVLVSNSMDSGWLPSNSTVQLRFQVNLSQDATITGDGKAKLDWDSNMPGSVDLSAQGLSNTGNFSISGLMEAIVSIKINSSLVGGSWDSDLFSSDIPLFGEAAFSPFSWNSTTDVNVVGDGSEVFANTMSVAGGFGEVGITGEIRPNCVTSLTENYLSLEGDRLDAQNSQLTYESPVGITSFSKNTTYFATVEAECALQLIPSISVRVFSTYYPWELTQIDLPPVSQDSVVNLQVGTPTFYLPSAEVNSPSVDFGSLEIGDSENAEVIIQNTGAATLEGSISLEDDSGAFEVFGSTLNVAPNSSSSIVVSFDALDTNQLYEGSLVLSTNDPAQPLITIPLSATTGTVEDNTNEPSGEVDGLTDDPEKKGCATADNSSAWFWLAGLALVGFRRTRGFRERKG